MRDSYDVWNVYERPDNIERARKLLRKFEYKYNGEKYHQGPYYLTPMDFYLFMKNKYCFLKYALNQDILLKYKNNHVTIFA